MLRPYGMREDAFRAYVDACYEVKINPNRVMQTIGSAAASAGTHGVDGSFQLKLTDGNLVWREYAACTDIRSKDLTKAQCVNLIRALAKRGFAAYWRYTGSFANNQHFHIIWSACKMKTSVQSQVKDFIDGKSGLIGHGPDVYWGKKENKISDTTRKLIINNFNANNSGKIKGLNDEVEEVEYEADCVCNADHLVAPDDVQ